MPLKHYNQAPGRIGRYTHIQQVKTIRATVSDEWTCAVTGRHIL